MLGGHNCITRDSVLKMVAIFMRLQCGIPVVLMGECGCGKTQLIKYTCEYWGVRLFTLDIHGGTTVEEIELLFEEVNQYLMLKSVEKIVDVPAGLSDQEFEQYLEASAIADKVRQLDYRKL